MTDIFLHIPKTGGMTLRTALKWIYGPGSCYSLPSDGSLRPDALFQNLPRHAVQDAGLICGHLLFGLHRHLDCACRYFTLLRDPVRRVISHYFYHLERYPDSKVAFPSLKDFLHSDHSIASSNRLVQFLSGKNPERVPETALREAKEHLANDVAVFGLTERFDESLLLFQTRLNWHYPPFYVRRKVNSARPSIEDLPDDTIEDVRRQNRLDADLYRFARERFGRMIEREIPNLESALPQFRRWNRVVQTCAPPLLALYRKGKSLRQGPSTPKS